MVTTFVIADDNTAVRSAMALMLTTRLGLRIAGEAADLPALTSLCANLHPDLVLLDWELPGFDHTRTSLSSLRACCPGVKVVVLSTRIESCLAAQEEGADAVIPKTEAPAAVAAILARLAGCCPGDPPFDIEWIDRL
jgi:DNA-binding NarL/FixJ family response regulator